MDAFLTGKTALVTGAARNLGRATAVMLAEHGANVIVHHHDEGSLADAEATADMVVRAGGRALMFAADLTDLRHVSALTGVLSEFGDLAVLVNNAGQIVKLPFEEVTIEEFDATYALNARAPFLLMQAAAKQMQAGGRIVNIATSVLACTYPMYGIYAGSKASMEHHTRAAALELRDRQITINTVAPGALDTTFFHRGEAGTPGSAEAIRQATGGLGKVEDVVPVIEFLVSPAARWVTGQTLFVNGGFVAR